MSAFVETEPVVKKCTITMQVLNLAEDVFEYHFNDIFRALQSTRGITVPSMYMPHPYRYEQLELHAAYVENQHELDNELALARKVLDINGVDPEVIYIGLNTISVQIVAGAEANDVHAAIAYAVAEVLYPESIVAFAAHATDSWHAREAMQLMIPAYDLTE